MKKIIIILLIAVISVSCLLSRPVQPTPKVVITYITTTPEPTNTPGPTRTPTITKTPKPSPTPTPDYYSIVGAQIESAKSKELIEVFKEFSKSEAVTIDDYRYDGARLLSLFSRGIDFQPEEFLIISKVKWEHTSPKITASSASCGFMFRNNDKDKSYFSVISADGNTRLINIKEDHWLGVAHKKVRSQSFNAQSDEVEFLMAVLPYRFVLAIDGEIIIDQNIEWDSTGYFGYSLISGTNRDYGTRCNFSDTVVFVNKMTSGPETSGG